MLEGKVKDIHNTEWTYMIDRASEMFFLFSEPWVPGAPSRTNPESYSFDTVRRRAPTGRLWEELLRVIEPYSLTIDTN